MRKVTHLVCSALYSFSMALMIVSCSEQEVEIRNEETQNVGLQTCTMNFKASLTEYEQSTRSSEQEVVWADNSRIYLQFLNGEERIAGEALYSAEQDSWSVSYYGSLPESASLTCEAIYFENIDSVTTAGLVVTNELTAIYEDLKGTYFYEEVY